MVLFTEYEFFKEFKLYHQNSLMDKEIKFDWLFLSLIYNHMYYYIIKLFSFNQIRLVIFFTYLCFWYTVGANLLWVKIIKEHNGGEQNHLDSRSTQFYNLFYLLFVKWFISYLTIILEISKISVVNRCIYEWSFLKKLGVAGLQVTLFITCLIGQFRFWISYF